MNDLHFAVCQIPLKISTNPVRVSNQTEHWKLVCYCIEKAIDLGANIVVFPEYGYLPEKRSEYLEYSKRIGVFAGSFQNESNYNETVFFSDGQVVSFFKNNLSPYEEIATPNPSRMLSSPEPVRPISIGSAKTLVLTCMDFFRLSRRLVEEHLQEGGRPELVVSSSCNNNARAFLSEAESNHFHRAGLTTIICNASDVAIDGKMSVNCGGSAVFGEYQPHLREDILKRGFCDSGFQQMIAWCSDGPKMLDVRILVPYEPSRKSTDDYLGNPKYVDVLVLNLA